jgi:hypothetical protein
LNADRAQILGGLRDIFTGPDSLIENFEPNSLRHASDIFAKFAGLTELLSALVAVTSYSIPRIRLQRCLGSRQLRVRDIFLESQSEM